MRYWAAKAKITAIKTTRMDMRTPEAISAENELSFTNETGLLTLSGGGTWYDHGTQGIICARRYEKGARGIESNCSWREVVGFQDRHNRLSAALSANMVKKRSTHTVSVEASTSPIEQSDNPYARRLPSGLADERCC